jgi:cold shock CspA family protein
MSETFDHPSINLCAAKEASARPRRIRRKDGASQRFRGVLLRLHDEGYGFIHTEESGDFYVNISAMQDRSAWKERTLVSFIPGNAKPGKAPPAYQVRAVHAPQRED